MRDHETEVAGETLRLLPERAVFWATQQTLLIADPHWGKGEAFRDAGLAVPGRTTEATLGRLSTALERTGAERLVILGDLFHARAGLTSELLAAVTGWRAGVSSLAITLVSGNHDRHAGSPPEGWRFECVGTEAVDGPFVYRHYPGESELGYVLSGHIHPAVELVGRGRQRLRLPCFWFTDRCGVLPAFGTFTGDAVVRPGQGDRVFVLAGEAVEPV